MISGMKIKKHSAKKSIMLYNRIVETVDVCITDEVIKVWVYLIMIYLRQTNIMM